MSEVDLDGGGEFTDTAPMIPRAKYIEQTHTRTPRDEIKLDFDTHKIDLVQHFRVRSWVFHWFNWWPDGLWVKTTRRGYHVYLFRTPAVLPDMTKVIIQFALGSDFVRELFNYGRVSQGMDGWNVLYNHKYKYNARLKKLRMLSRERTDVELTRRVLNIINRARRKCDLCRDRSYPQTPQVENPIVH